MLIYQLAQKTPAIVAGVFFIKVMKMRVYVFFHVSRANSIESIAADTQNIDMALKS